LIYTICETHGQTLIQLSNVELLQIVVRGQGMTEVKLLQIAAGQISEVNI